MVCRVAGGVQVDPLYQEISGLFDGADEIVKDDATQLQLVDLPDELAAREFLANIVAGRSEAWAKMYDAVGGSAGLSAKMLEGEKKRTLNGVKRVLQQLGIPRYDVPVTFQAHIPEWERPEVGEASQLNDFLAGAHVAQLARKADADGVVLPATPSPADTVALPIEDAWHAHRGAFEFQIDGAIPVYASSAERADLILAKLHRFLTPLLREMY